MSEEQKNEEIGENTESTLAEDVRTALRSVKDPELDLNIVDLGLVYDIEIVEAKANIKITLTSPGCPAGPEIVADAERAAAALDGIESAEVEIVWEPFWSPEKMDPRVRAFLGM